VRRRAGASKVGWVARGGGADGHGPVVFAQAAVAFGLAIGLAHAVGSDLVHGSAPDVLPSALMWLVLGYAFYGWVDAAAASMTERQADVQDARLPARTPGHPRLAHGEDGGVRGGRVPEADPPNRGTGPDR
jgi:hypothetical protein